MEHAGGRGITSFGWGRSALIAATGVALGAAALVGTPGGGALASSVSPASSTPPSTNYAVIKAVNVGVDPLTVAVNSADDSVYVVNSGANTVSVIDGLSGAVANTLNLGAGLDSMAVNERTGTVYVAKYENLTPPVIATISGSTVSQIPMNIRTYGIAVNQRDDTVYATDYSDNHIAIVSAQYSDDSGLLPVGRNPVRIAVNQVDDTVYVVNNGAGNPSTLTVLNGRNPADDSTALSVGNGAWGIAVAAASEKIYVANNSGAGSVTVIDGRTLATTTIPQVSNAWEVAVDERINMVYVTDFYGGLSFVNGATGVVSDDTLMLPGLSYGVAVDDSGVNQGLIYVTAYNSNQLMVVGQVSAAGVPVSGAVGDDFALGLSVADLSPSFVMDDSTVASVLFGSTPATVVRGAGNSWDVTVPAGSGSVPVTVQLNGGLSVSAGTFSYGGSPGPSPDPVFPPGEPVSVNAVAGDGEARVSWGAPVSSGSFAVTDYEVTVSPGGQSCLAKAPELSCTVSGLSNGTSYTARVRALNGAGWGAYSGPSNELRPSGSASASIVITGSRGEVRGRPGVMVSGVTTGLVGQSVRARVRLPGELEYRDGTSRVVDASGEFMWQRKTGKRVYVYFRAEDDSVRSNRLIIPVG